MTTANPTTSPARALASFTTPSIRRDQLWIPAGIVTAALIVLAGWVLFVSPERDQASQLNSQAAASTTAADTLQRRLTTLAAQNKDLARYKADLAAAQQALPTTPALPAFLRTLQDIGSATGVEVSGLSATPPTAVTTAAGGTGTAGTTGTTGTTGAGGSGTVTAGGAGTAGSAGTAALGSVYQVTMTVTAKGSYDSLAGFLKQLQQVQPRAVLVTAASEQADSQTTTLTLNLEAFMAPGPGSTGPASK